MQQILVKPFAVLTLVLALGCGNAAPSAPGAAPKPASQVISSSERLSAPTLYPPGRWRSRLEILNDYYVSLAHILITHNQSDVAALAGYWPWRQAWSPNARTRDQAFEVARELFEQLQTDPTQFEASARE